jgi:hypothetical protein
MARLLTTSSLLIAFSLFSALQTGASPIQIPDHHSKRTEAKRDEVDLMKRDPLASLHESLHELVARYILRRRILSVRVEVTDVLWVV